MNNKLLIGLLSVTLLMLTSCASNKHVNNKTPKLGGPHIATATPPLPFGKKTSNNN